MSGFGDLWLATTIMLGVSVAGALAVRRLFAGRPKPVRVIGAAVLCAFALIASLVLADSVAMVRWMPVSAVSVYGNWTPVIVFALVGLVAVFGELPRWRRLLLSGMLLMAGGVALAQPLARRPPPCGNARQGTVYIQTTASTCSAAAAATLLGMHGIQTTEGEMAALCLTTATGTRLTGLYRGLRIKTASTRLGVRISTESLESLKRDVVPPAILSMQLTDAILKKEPRYRADWGWEPGVIHDVVFLGFVGDGKVKMADPSVGIEEWSDQALADLWNGNTVALVEDR